MYGEMQLSKTSLAGFRFSELHEPAADPLSLALLVLGYMQYQSSFAARQHTFWIEAVAHAHSFPGRPCLSRLQVVQLVRNRFL